MGPLYRDAGIAQLVERNLAKVEVASSRLVSRSNFQKGSPDHNTASLFAFAHCEEAMRFARQRARGIVII